jgi:riboflavin kinase / FMN adenylyltransferase
MVSNSQPPVVLTMGVFDGVHAGHRALMAHAAERAGSLNGSVTAATFDPHPTAFLRPELFLGLLTLVERRSELLLEAGADHVEVLKFDLALSHMSPEDFVSQIVVDQLQASVVIVGTNFRFGHKAEGDVALLQQFGLKYGFEVEVFELVGEAGGWSSTRIRQAVLDGDVEVASSLLGRPHRLTGTVVHGDHRGRELGFPTANLDVHGGLIIPADGVYSGLLRTATEIHPVAVSIGTNPTFEGVVGRRVEAHVIGRTDLDLYDQMVELDFIGFVRGMQAFSGIEPLIVAMNHDVEVAQEQVDSFFGSEKSAEFG